MVYLAVRMLSSMSILSTSYLLFPQVLPSPTIPEPQQAGKENLLTPFVGKHSLVLNLQKTIARKGNPEILAPGKRQERRVEWGGGPLTLEPLPVPVLASLPATTLEPLLE